MGTGLGAPMPPRRRRKSQATRPSGARLSPGRGRVRRPRRCRKVGRTPVEAGKLFAGVVGLLGSAAVFSFVSERCASPPKRSPHGNGHGRDRRVGGTAAVGEEPVLGAAGRARTRIRRRCSSHQAVAHRSVARPSRSTPRICSGRVEKPNPGYGRLLMCGSLRPARTRAGRRPQCFRTAKFNGSRAGRPHWRRVGSPDP